MFMYKYILNKEILIMAIVNQSTLIGNKVAAQQFVDTEIDAQTPPDNITAEELNIVLTRIISLIEDVIQSSYNTVDKIAINNIYQGTTTNTLDVILNNYQLKINPINTAFNKNFGIGGNSIDIPRFDDPRFTDMRIPVNNSVSTIKLQDNSVTNSKLDDMPLLTIKGNNTSITATPLDLTVSQVRTMLNIQDGAQVNFTGKNSITIDSNQYQLVNDILAPGNFYYYGTNNIGTKGFFTLESAINNYVTNLNGDGWGNQTAVVQTPVINPTTTNSFNILLGDGLISTPLTLSGSGLRDFINDVVSVSVIGDNWGSQVVQNTAGGGILGAGTTASKLVLDIKHNTSLSGVGTVASPLQIEEGWLTTYISDYLTNNGADNWGSQVAQTSGLITGDGLIGNRIRLSNGSLSTNQLILWDFTQQIYKLTDSAGFANEFLNVNTTAPIIGNGSVSNKVRLEDGLAINNILQWDGSIWNQVSLPTVISNNITANNGIIKTGINLTLGGTLNQATNIITNGNLLDLTYTNLPSAFIGDSQITKFGYSLNATHDESRALLGLTAGDYVDFNAATADYKYVYSGIEYTDGNQFVTGALFKQAGIFTSESTFRVDSNEISIRLSGNYQVSLEVNEDNGAFYSSTNDLGIRYIGFGESSIDNDSMAGADYSSLQFNSLVPKKYVDDSITAVSGTISNYSYNNGLNNLTPGDVRLGGALINDTTVEGTFQFIEFSSNLSGLSNEKLYFGIGNNLIGGNGEDAVGIMYKDNLSSDNSYVIAIPNQIDMATTDGTSRSQITLGVGQLALDFGDGITSTGLYLTGGVISMGTITSSISVDAITGDIDLTTVNSTTKVNIILPSDSEGITGTFDYSLNYVDNSYVQKVYVDSKIVTPFIQTQNITASTTNIFVAHNLGTALPTVKIYLVDYPSVGRNTLLNSFGTSVPTFLENLIISTNDNDNIQITCSPKAACKVSIVVTK